MSSLAERLAAGLEGVDGLQGMDEAQLVGHVIAEVRRAVADPLNLPDDADVAARWSDVLGGFYTAKTVGELLGGISRQAVSKRGDLLALHTGRGRVVHPRMQFRRSRPAPGMAEVLAAVPEPVIDRWTLAGWLAGCSQQPPWR